jgi:hypothetical protein
MGHTLRNRKRVEYNPSLAGRAGRYSSSGQRRTTEEEDGNTRKTRRAAEKENKQQDRRKKARSTIIESIPTPDVTSMITLPPRTRGNQPLCLHFGITVQQREDDFPEGIWCPNCERVSDDLGLAKKINLASKRYKCKANHPSFNLPATRKKAPPTVLKFDGSDSPPTPATPSATTTEDSPPSEISEAPATPSATSNSTEDSPPSEMSEAPATTTDNSPLSEIPEATRTTDYAATINNSLRLKLASSESELHATKTSLANRNASYKNLEKCLKRKEKQLKKLEEAVITFAALSPTELAALAFDRGKPKKDNPKKQVKRVKKPGVRTVPRRI